MAGVVFAALSAGTVAAQNLSPPLPNPVIPPPPLSPDANVGVPEDTRLCLQRLSQQDVEFSLRGRVEGAGPCGIDHAVALERVGGALLNPAAILACPTALQFGRFWSDHIEPSALTVLGQIPTRVHVAASYVCRSRNNVENARISEHAFGRAIDIRGLELADGTRWSVQPHPPDAEGADAQFQARLRDAACGPFTTVLGPGSDGFHEDHLHFDMANRSSTYCR